jgi:hypothetical protein
VTFRVAGIGLQMLCGEVRAMLRIGDTTIKGPADLRSAVAVLSLGSTAVIEVLREYAHSTINLQF